ncbi:phosphatase PAP2 family protein [Haloimpatiens sp. FM7330]|uniref:phosphatase PAP2 family protein n=1 Tax=Haloimpatiens sp. FM7330 TaxID=3298610 RepID=UPI0036308D97
MNKDFWNKYIGIIVGTIFAIAALYSYITTKNIDWSMYLVFISFAAFTIKKDMRHNIKLSSFLIFSIPFIIFLVFLQKYGYEIWGKVLKWQITKNLGWNWNEVFSKIPFNDASFARIFQPDWLTAFFRFVYNSGFVVPVVIPIYRAAMCKDLRKMIRYALSGHILQIFLISPFYAAIRLQEVWYVLGHPDGLARNFTPEQAAGWTLNCFPSMHTSIAFAMFLVVLHEKDKIFKWVWAAFCLSVIYSTMYLEIHWIIDVIAGMVLALVTVKLVDLILNLLEKYIPNKFKDSYYTNNTNSDISM